MYDLLLGTVQGSILGMIFFAIFVLSLFDIKHFLTFADDNYIPKVSNKIKTLIEGMEKALELITK
jgi:hypothetical protein